MAGVGTFHWAEEKFEEIEQKFNDYIEKAEEMGTSVLEEAGRENLRELSNRLDDIIDVLENHSTESAKELKEKAVALNHEVLNAKFN